MATDTGLCPEHVWELAGLMTGHDGRLMQQFGCARCPAQLLVEPGQPGPHSPEMPG